MIIAERSAKLFSLNKMSINSEKLSGITERILKDKKSVVLVAMAVVGMLLIFLSGESDRGKEVTKADNHTEYADDYEEKLERLISKIEGVGKVSVMITYESGTETVFASDKEESFRNGEQKIRNDYIVVDGSDGETGLKIKSVYPEIKGVAVVCSGASDPFIKERIVSVVSALFDISTKNISVVSAEN